MSYKKELVVAKYEEDINWIKDCNNIDMVTVYDKNENRQENINTLPNIGRESHTYLYHIINNYNNLSDYTIFCQGDPIFHDHHFVEKINNIDSIILSNIKKGFYFFAGECKEEINETYSEKHPVGLPISYFLDLLFDIKIPQKINITYNCSAQFLVKKQNLLNRPKSFYRFLINFVSNEKDPIEGYVFERIWKFIIDKNIPTSNKYKRFMM
jgi:hypothetical protein